MHQERTEQMPNLALSVMLAAFLALLLCANVKAEEVFTSPASNCNACDGTATFIPDNPTSVYALVWSNSDGDLIEVTNTQGETTLSGLCPGLYELSWSSGDLNGNLIFSVGLPGPDAGNAVNIALCTGSGNTNLFTRLQGQPTAGGTWLNPAGEAATGIFNPTTGIPGLYTYNVNVNGCQLTSGVWVSVIQNADPGLSTTYLICEDYDPFFLTDVLAGTPDYGGQWFNGQQQPIDGFYNPETDDTQLFTYMIDTVPGCPPVFSTMFVIENILPNPGESTVLAVCPNAVPFNMTEMLGGTPSQNGVWTNNINTPVGNIFDPQVLPQGNYTYTVQGLTPCPSQEATLTITFTDEISAGSPAPANLCSTQTTFNLFNALSGNVTQGGVWVDPSGNETDPVQVVSEMQPGNYVYSIDAVGCQPVSSMVPVAIEDPVNAGPGGVLDLCETASPIVLNTLYGQEATPNGAWSVNGTPIGGSLIVEGGQTYTLVYEVEADICPPASATYVVNAGLLPEVPPSQTVSVCASSGFLDLQPFLPPAGNFEVAWNDPAGEPMTSLIPLNAESDGVYTYTVLSGNACPNATTTLSLTIDLPAFPLSNLSTELCYTGGLLDLNALGGGLPAGGEWSVEGSTVPSPLPSSQVTSGVYQYTYDNANACEISVFVLDLTLVSPLSAGSGATLTICSTEPPFHPENFITGASSGGSWLWNNEPNENPIFDPSVGEDAYFTYVIPAVGPCPGDSSYVEVIVDSGFAYTAGPDQTVCADAESVVLGAGECLNCTYAWQPQTGLSNPSAASPTYTWGNVTTTQTQVFSVTVSNGICTIGDNVSVTVHPTPSVTINGPLTACLGSTATFVAGGAPSYEWNLSTGETIAGSSFTHLLTDDLELTLTGTNALGCSSQAEWSVEALLPPMVVTDIPPVGGCAPLEIQLEAIDVQEDWLAYWLINGQEYPLDDHLTIEDAGVYDLTLFAIANNGCSASFTTDAAFDIYPSPYAWFEPEPATVSVSDPQIHFVNGSQDITSWIWDFGGLGTSEQFSPRYTFPEVADQGYRVCLEVENAFGCLNEMCRDVFVKGEMTIYVPNAFTPDGDGINEVFRPYVSGIVEGSYELRIFNRWGELIFSADDPQAFWRGDVGGGDHYAQNGAYIWLITARDAYTAEARRFEGHVMLLR